MTETETKKLYNGEVKIDFYPKSHRFKKDGEWIPSVTSFLNIIAKRALIQWAANMAADYLLDLLREGEPITAQMIQEARYKHKDIKKEAADTGSQVHEWAENYIKTGKIELPKDQDVRRGIKAFLTWIDQHKVVFKSSERVVYSKDHHYVGILDAEAEIDGKLYLIDFKTSKGYYPEFDLQVAAYQRAAEEEGSKYDGRAIVRFDKLTGKFEYIELPMENYLDDLAAFLSAMKLKQWKDSKK